MAVSAHPADFCSRSGGTLIIEAEKGSTIKVVWMTHGETDESSFLYENKPGISIPEVRKIREKEAFTCAEILGVEGKMLGFGDNPLRMTQDRIETLAKEISDFKPDIILTHWKNEVTYPTHWVTSDNVMKAAQLAHLRTESWNIRFFEPNLGTAVRVGFIPDFYVDISSVFEKKLKALRALAAQPELIHNYTVCGQWRGRESGCEYAEGFVHFPPVPRLLKRLT